MKLLQRPCCSRRNSSSSSALITVTIMAGGTRNLLLLPLPRRVNRLLVREHPAGEIRRVRWYSGSCRGAYLIIRQKWMAAIVYDFYSNLSYCCYLPEIDGKRAMSCFENPQYA